MFNAMGIAEMVINYVNNSLGITKYIAWNELHQKSASELFEESKNMMVDENCMTVADWCFDLYTFNALSYLLKYAEENNEEVIISYEYGLAVLCKSKDVLKDVLKKLPKNVFETTQYNIKDIELLDDSCLITYNNKQKQIMFEKRPDYIYKLLTNNYE